MLAKAREQIVAEAVGCSFTVLCGRLAVTRHKENTQQSTSDFPVHKSGTCTGCNANGAQLVSVAVGKQALGCIVVNLHGSGNHIDPVRKTAVDNDW